MEIKQKPVVYLAPFQGITTHIFREVYTRFFGDVDKLFTAFFTGIQSERSLRSHAKELVTTHHAGVPVVPQILSKDAREMLRFARMCHNRGFDEINWNLGCPFPRVARKKRGSGLLPYPEEIQSILEYLMPQIPVRLSVKCRLGYSDANEILALLPVFHSFPLSELIVHARLGVQMYKGQTDLVSFEEVLRNSKIPLVYNGDIFSPDGFNVVKRRFPSVQSWMLGRGVLADPFLPALIKGEKLPSHPETVVRRYVDELYYAYRKIFHDDLRALNRLKELWSYLSLSFDQPERVFGKIKKTRSFAVYEEAVRYVFDSFGWQGLGGKKLTRNNLL